MAVSGDRDGSLFGPDRGMINGGSLTNRTLPALPNTKRAPDGDLATNSYQGPEPPLEPRGPTDKWSLPCCAQDPWHRMHMSRRADCWGNPDWESFFWTLKNELIDRRSWLDRASVRDAISQYIEVFCNRAQRHSTIGNVSPPKFEEMDHAMAGNQLVHFCVTRPGPYERENATTQGS